MLNWNIATSKPGALTWSKQLPDRVLAAVATALIDAASAGVAEAADCGSMICPALRAVQFVRFVMVTLSLRAVTSAIKKFTRNDPDMMLAGNW